MIIDKHAKSVDRARRLHSTFESINQVAKHSDASGLQSNDLSSAALVERRVLGTNASSSPMTIVDCEAPLLSFYFLSKTQAIAIAVFHVEVTATVGLITNVPCDLHALRFELSTQRI